MMIHSGNKTRQIVIQSVSSWLSQTATWLYYQVRYLPDEIESHIICESTQNLDQFPNSNIHSLSDAAKIRYFWDLGLQRLHVRRYLGFHAGVIEKTGADILHSHFGDRGWMDIDLARRAGLKHIVTFYGLDVNYLPQADRQWHQRYRELFDRVNLVLCEGPHMANCIIGLGCPENKTQVHHLGVAVDKIPFKPRVYTPRETLRVLIASSFREKKGVPYAIEALGRLQEHVPLEITIIGDATNEERFLIEKQKIQDSIKRHNLQNKTRLLGYQPHAVLYDEAYRHHIFLSPSVTAKDGDTEGGAPISIIEMLATGMPVISTRHCDIPNIVRHGVSGLLADERNSEELFQHMKWMIEHPEQWTSMSEAGRKHVETEFNVKIQAGRLASIYRAMSDKE